MSHFQDLDAQIDDELEDAVLSAVDRTLQQVPREKRAEALRTIRMEMERTLTNAPITGDPVEALGVRAKLAAILATF